MVIEWESFVLVAAVSLAAASIVVTVASLGIRLHENSVQARALRESTGRWPLAASRVLFAFCALAVIFGIYLIVPAFH